MYPMTWGYIFVLRSTLRSVVSYDAKLMRDNGPESMAVDDFPGPEFLLRLHSECVPARDFLRSELNVRAF